MTTTEDSTREGLILESALVVFVSCIGVACTGAGLFLGLARISGIMAWALLTACLAACMCSYMVVSARAKRVSAGIAGVAAAVLVVHLVQTGAHPLRIGVGVVTAVLALGGGRRGATGRIAAACAVVVGGGLGL